MSEALREGQTTEPCGECGGHKVVDTVASDWEREAKCPRCNGSGIDPDGTPDADEPTFARALGIEESQ